MNKEEQIKWYWNHIVEESKSHRDLCTCHLCIQLMEKGYTKIEGKWYDRSNI